MECNIYGKKIIGITEGPGEIELRFEGGMRLLIMSSAHVTLNRRGTLKVYASIHVSTDKVELKAEG